MTVLERDTVGAGGTGRSSAIIRQHYSNELTARMALHSLRVFQDFDEHVGGECGFQATGWVAIAAAKDRAGLQANVELQRRVGIQTRLLSVEELREIMPALEAGELVAAAYEPESGYADPHLTVNAYADAAKRQGAKIVVSCEVVGVRFAGDKVVGVDTSTERFDAPVVVNCAGPWGARVAELAGSVVPINSCRVQVAVFRRPPGQQGPHPVVMDFIDGIYLRAETGGLTITGSIDPGEADAVVDPDDYPEHVDDEFVADMGERFLQRCPALELSQSMGGFASLYAVTPDWHPIVDELPAGSGCFICSGFSGHGFKLGPAVGLMTADRITEEASPEFPVHAFRFGRFAENDLVRGQYEYSIAG
ncbi:MAG: FAD-dependent oxidoreductase [Gemmatimonadales bacterium]|nr:FAD-dependent oxidoreductase [Gemmatimonadales bacterium]NIN10540.1 FAD-dependent oxidoreductase [Gemmatimonadales bacterium]NIN49324.1 FAD-dependent oxidoreductase [Gemmatimonadales bacterium]NIP06788.1 FAD-dependent oxidoreductase [Gemmatimonadales bacterium]NIQ98905.1 FAD-dependent oxidoreductase [Gemmatimonadales bacterium]